MSVTALDAVLICPNRALAQEFSAQLARSNAFKLLADIKTYPPPQQFEDQMRQSRPAVILLDLGSDPDAAIALIESQQNKKPGPHFVGIHDVNDANLIIRALRAGATEFLCAPFDSETQNAVVSRVNKLRATEHREAPPQGKVAAFVAAKAGQGVTTIALNVAAAMTQGGTKRVLLTDLDIEAGTISFSWRVTHSYSTLDALRHSEKLDVSLWNALVTNRNGVDILLAPEVPEGVPLDAHRFHEVIEYARTLYDYVVIDLPSVWSKQAKATLGDVDQTYIVCNPELPSLHLTRKCIGHLEQMGFTRDQFTLIVNRMSRRQELGPADMERVFNFPIGKVFNEDNAAVHRALTAGKPIPTSCELGRSVSQFGLGIFDSPKQEKKRSAAGLKLSALLSQS